jgi:hypothetical protein
MKKVLLWVGGIFIVLMIIGALSSGKNGNTDTQPAGNTNTQSNGSTDSGSPAPEASTAPQKEKITLSNATYKSEYGTTTVIGEATNNDTVKHSMFLKATFYDANKKLLGTASGAVNEIAPGDTKTYTLMGTDDVSGYKEMKVQIDSLF